MTVNAKSHSMNWQEGQARNVGQWPALLLGAFVAAQGALPVGLILTKGAAGYKPYQAVNDEAVGTGNGATKNYTHTALQLPIEPGSLSVTDGVETFVDDGLGRLVGSAGGTGSVYYESGKISLAFAANVANLAAIVADYETRVDAVLDEPIDTASDTSALVIVFGPVTHHMLKVGATAQAAPSAALVARLAAKHIFAV